MMFVPLPARKNVLAYGLPTPLVRARMPINAHRFSRQGADGLVVTHIVDDGFTTSTNNPDALMDNSEDKRIIEAVLAGHVVQFASLVERYQKPIYSFMLRLTSSPSDAEDLTQEVFIRAFEKLRRFKNNRRFFPWLYTIAVNRGRDHLRKKGLQSKLFTEKPVDFQGPDHAAEDCSGKPDCHIIVGEIVDAMERLPLSYREPLLLYYREEFSIKEIAASLKISATAVKARLHRGRKMLKRLIGEQYAIDRQ